MMLPHDTLHLRHMRDALHRLEEYVARTTREDFERDTLIQDGFIRQLTILGEAAGKVSPAFAQTRQRFPGQT